MRDNCFFHGESFISRCFAVGILICFLFLFVTCSRQQRRDELSIAVSIPPQAWFVSQIAGDKVKPLILVGKGQNPHNYEPTPKQIQSLASANAWILSGTEFEISLAPKVKALFPELLIIDGTEGVQFRLLEDHDDHDGDDDHSSLEIDRHTWLGKGPAIILAGHIRDALITFDSENTEYYFERTDNLVRVIEEEFDILKETLASLEGKTVFVYHPSFGYFLDEFDIHQEAVETGGKEPTPRVLNNLIVKLKEEQAAVVFVQAQFPVNAAKTLADAVNAELVMLDPLAEDWLENIRFMGQALQASHVSHTLQKASP